MRNGTLNFLRFLKSSRLLFVHLLVRVAHTFRFASFFSAVVIVNLISSCVQYTVVFLLNYFFPVFFFHRFSAGICSENVLIRAFFPRTALMRSHSFILHIILCIIHYSYYAVCECAGAFALYSGVFPLVFHGYQVAVWCACRHTQACMCMNVAVMTRT